MSNGSLYGALALALVVVYRASGRLNLAQGELATMGTYVSLVLTSPATPALAGTAFVARWLPGTPWPIWLAVPGAMVVMAVLAALVERLLISRIPETSARAAVSVSIGLLLLINGLDNYIWKPVSRGYDSLFPNDPDDYLTIFGARLRFEMLGTWITLIIVLGLLALLLRTTKAGLAFRAVSSSRVLAGLMGVRSQRVLTGGWALAGALGTLVGCLLASRLVLEPSMMIRLLVYSFAAATIGGLTSMGGAIVGGLIVGLSQTMLSGYVGFVGGRLSLPVVLLGMVLMLYLRPQGLFGTKIEDEAPSKVLGATAAEAVVRPRFAFERGTSGARAATMVGAVAMLALALVPAFVLPIGEGRLWTELLATTIALWGLALLLGPAAQLSLGHSAFLGLGAYATLVVATRYDVSPLLGLAVAGLCGLLIGALVGLPALRIRGQYLAMVTFSLAVAFPMIIQRFSWFTGGSGGPPPLEMQVPSWLNLPAGKGYLWLHIITVFVAAATVAVLANLDRSPVGRAIRASADNDLAATSMGVRVVATKTWTFGVASMIGAVAGGLLALHTQAVTSETFDVQMGLIFYGAAVFGGVNRRIGAPIGALLIVGVPYLTAHEGWDINEKMLFGVLLIVGTAFFPDGLGSPISGAARRLVGIVDGPPRPPAGHPDSTDMLPELVVEGTRP